MTEFILIIAAIIVAVVLFDYLMAGLTGLYLSRKSNERNFYFEEEWPIILSFILFVAIPAWILGVSKDEFLADDRGGP